MIVGATGVLVGGGVLDGWRVAPTVGVGLGAAVGVSGGAVGIAVSVGSGVGSLVNVGLGVAVGLGDSVGVGEKVAVGFGNSVGVGEEVAVGSACVSLGVGPCGLGVAVALADTGGEVGTAVDKPQGRYLSARSTPRASSMITSIPTKTGTARDPESASLLNGARVATLETAGSSWVLISSTVMLSLPPRSLASATNRRAASCGG